MPSGEADGAFELTNTKIASTLNIAGQMPAIYDLIFREFPAAYNDGGNRFGRLGAVKMASDMKTKPVSAFEKSSVHHSYPEGFILPLVYGVSALLAVNEDNEVEWLVDDPVDFVSNNLISVVRRYRAIIEAFSGDPQKIGKNNAAYAIAKDAFEAELFKAKQAG